MQCITDNIQFLVQCITDHHRIWHQHHQYLTSGTHLGHWVGPSRSVICLGNWTAPTTDHLDGGSYPSSALVTIIWNHHGIIQPSTAWQSSLYHCFIKHGNGKSLRNRGFITNITDQWSVFQQCLTTPEATLQRNQRTHGNHELPVVVIPNCSLWLPSENHYNCHQGTIHTTTYRVW